MSANLVFLNGRIASELELKRTNSGKGVMSFSVAVRASEDKSEFIPVVVWGKTAEFVKQYFSKGDGINITGRISTRTWEENGKNRKAVEVTVREVGFPDGKKGQAESQSKTADIESDDDLPC